MMFKDQSSEKKSNCFTKIFRVFRRRSFGKKIQQLQKEDFLPYEHAHIEADLKEFKYWTYPKERWVYSWNKISILEYLLTLFCSSESNVKLQSDRFEILRVCPKPSNVGTKTKI
ncbi:hypothetical protein FH589_14065 [Leptospira interrogans]|uniref:hypothetical protein n=1 Tax=Leptospira interrogans TaxID=173 RepID=UPI001EF0AD72|nr:hypothetical protein [Leptospira interrogans]ULG80418.1 hypothetical protein FH595_17135 [Leptospira interrogans]UML68054.1 hypothetical protein FH589_14065 [Leptospira interrogans]UML71375.1 hypothetical protein FH598_12275 [Leptospira interrogans]